MYRVKLTAIHGNKGTAPLLCTVTPKRLDQLMGLKNIIKTKVLESIFTKSGKFTREVGKENIEAWIQAVKDASEGKITLDNAGLKKGDYFRFDGETITRVYYAKVRNKYRHMHYKFDAASEDTVTTKGNREIDINFTF